MTIQQMKYYFQVCQWQNITKAADSLHIAQSSLSLAMQNLEKETGLNLFRHVGRRIEITADGQKLLTKVTTMLSSIEKFDKDVRELANKHSTIRIAIPPQITLAIIPSLLTEFPQLYPEIKLEIIEVSGKELVELVRKEDVDLGLINLFEEKHSDIHYSRIRKIPIGIIVNAENPLAEHENISYEETIQNEMILLESNHFVTQMAIHAFDKNKLEPKVIYYTKNLSTIYQSIRESNKISILTGYAAMDNALKLIPFAEPLELTTYSVTKKGHQINNDEKILLKFIKAKLCSII